MTTTFGGVPEESKIFFLGEHTYSIATQVSATMETTLAIILAVCDLNSHEPKPWLMTHISKIRD
jgi:hypothetical protein